MCLRNIHASDQSCLSTCRNNKSLGLVNTDQTAQLSRLIWVFAEHTCYFVTLLCSYIIESVCNGFLHAKCFLWRLITVDIWAGAWQNLQNGMCAQPKTQFRFCIHTVWSEFSLPFGVHRVPRELCRCAGWSVLVGHICHVAGFAMS